AVEHLLGHDGLLLLSPGECGLYRGATPLQLFFFQVQQFQVRAQRRRLLLPASQYLPDVLQGQAQIPQEQDPLQPQQAGRAVVPVAICPDARGSEQTDVVVVAQGPAGGAGGGGPLLHGPLRPFSNTVSLAAGTAGAPAFGTNTLGTPSEAVLALGTAPSVS